jgi:hypothetical protein
MHVANCRFDLLITHSRLSGCDRNLDFKIYSTSLKYWIEHTIKTKMHGSVHIDSIRSLWGGEEWKSVVSKFESKSVIYWSWWMRGLYNYIAVDLGWYIAEVQEYNCKETACVKWPQNTP